MANKKSKKQDTALFIAFVLDKSGSMATCRQQTISGFNEFRGDQEREGAKLGSPTVMSLTLFDTAFEQRHTARPIGKVPDLTTATYEPNGFTALYDAIGATIRTTEQVSNLPAKVLFVIQTDGQENSSREWTREKVFALISEKRTAGWAFMFLGADQDAYAASAALGIAQGSTLSYASAKTGAAFDASSRSATSYRRGLTDADNLTVKR